MLKKYSELVKIDVLPYCEVRDSRDDKGKKIEVHYLNWAKCKELLHTNGAETVYFEPLINERTGSTLFMTDIAFGEEGKTNRCFEVRVKIVIDDLEFIQNYPLLNGIYVVREDTVNQLRLSNAQARAFVKGVAIRTGLGFSLWIKDDETIKTVPVEDLSSHSIKAIKKRILELVTVKMQNGLSTSDIAHGLNISEDEFKSYLTYPDILDRFEKAISKL